MVYKYKKPFNFEEESADFRFFKSLTQSNFKDSEIKIFKNIRIATNSVLFNYFKIIPESCITHGNYKLYSSGYKFFLKYIFPKFYFSKKNLILITDEHTSNYYHWHTFALKKLLILKEKNLLQNFKLFLPIKYKKYKFVFPSLEKFGIKESDVVFLRKKSNIKAKQVITAIAPRQDEKLYKDLREIITKNTKSEKNNSSERIYISREGQKIRLVENENEVAQLLEKYGFKKVIAEKLSYDDQISLMKNTKYLVAPHGAGLTNILFMDEGSFVLEMAGKQDAATHNPDYYILSSMIGLNYLYQECEISQNSKVRDFHQGNLIIDLEKLEKNLQLMLK